MKTYTRVSYDVLSKVFKEGAFSSPTLYRAAENVENPELVYKIVLGVLDRNAELEYIIGELVKKRTQNAVSVVLKIGIYCLKYMNGLTDYAVINNCVNLVGEIGKTGVSGFVNAVLKAAARGEYSQPDETDKPKFWSVKYGKPQWLAEKLIADFGEYTAEKVLSAQPCAKAHVRVNSRTMKAKTFEKQLADNGIDYEKSDVGGYFLNVNPFIKKLFAKGDVTFQSVTSMYAVSAMEVADGTDVLDLCAAPGGKSVLISERNPHGTVTACDIYPHRAELVKSYARRMKAENIKVEVLDATLYEESFSEKFSAVLADVPCSALGIVGKQPDILLNRKPEDILSLQKLQKSILNNAAKYVKKGGTLVYSTCTYTLEENDDVVNDFLKNNGAFELAKIKSNYENDGCIRFLPSGCVDGFFICKMVKK